MPIDFDVGAVRRQFSGSNIGHDVRHFESVDSTNRVAMGIPSGEWTTGTVIMAEHQDAGRGRAGRIWLSRSGTSVMLSVLFAKVSGIGLGDYVMLGALSVRDAVVSVTGLTATLKWPNDVLINGRKVSGILGEYAALPAPERIVVGMGINVNFAPDDFQSISGAATALNVEAGSNVSRQEIALALIQALNLWYRDLTHRPERVFEAWTGALETIGRPVIVNTGKAPWTGIALGVRRDGGLLVQTDDGRVQSVYAGDVSVRHER